MSDLISDDELVDTFAHLGVARDSAAHFRARLERRLVIDRCEECGRYQHPPQPICPSCWSTNMTPTEITGNGTIHLLILLHQGPPAPGVDYDTPYPVATVELDEQPGLRFTATVVGSDNDDIAIGKRVGLAWIDRARVPTPAFRLAEAAS